MKNNKLMTIYSDFLKEPTRGALLFYGFLMSIFSCSLVHAGTPYSGEPISLPGVIEAENFDLGGMGDAYYDNSPQNIGGAIRMDESVDIESSSTGGYNLGWMESGEWLEYSVNIQQDGEYDVNARIASPNGQGRIEYEFAGPISVSTNQVNISHTGGWQSWRNSDAVRVFLVQGEYKLRVHVRQSGFNLDSIFVSRVGSEGDNKLAAYPDYTGNYPGFFARN